MFIFELRYFIVVHVHVWKVLNKSMSFKKYYRFREHRIQQLNQLECVIFISSHGTNSIRSFTRWNVNCRLALERAQWEIKNERKSITMYFLNETCCEKSLITHISTFYITCITKIYCKYIGKDNTRLSSEKNCKQLRYL